MRSEKLDILMNVLAWLSLNATEKWRFTLDSHSLVSATFVCTSMQKLLENNGIPCHSKTLAFHRNIEDSRPLIWAKTFKQYTVLAKYFNFGHHLMTRGSDLKYRHSGLVVPLGIYSNCTVMWVWDTRLGLIGSGSPEDTLVVLTRIYSLILP